MSTQNSSLSIIVPVYNEVGIIDCSLSAIDEFCAIHFGDYEVLVIESGSTDGSFEKCDEVARLHSRVRVIHEGARNGFGAALQLGYNHAAKDLVLLVTLDLPFPLDATLRALPLLASHDYVLSYRAKDPRAWTRRMQSAVYNFLVRMVLNLRVRHINSGFKLYHRSDLLGMPIQSRGWFIDAEILFRLQSKGLRYAEIPVELVERPSGKSSVGAFAFVDVLRELWRFRRAYKRGRL